MKIIPLSTPVCLLTILLAGCHLQPATTAPSTRTATVPAPQQSQAEGVARAYVSALQTGNYPEAAQRMSPRLRAQLPAPAWKMGRRGALQPMATAKDLTFDSAQTMSHGRRMILRAHFTGGDGTQYHTNFVLAQSGPSWLVDSVIPPVARQSVSGRQGGLTSRQ